MGRRDCRPNPPGPRTSRARRDIATRRSASADVPRGHPPGSKAAVRVVTTGSCAAKSRSACSSSVSTTARPYESSSVRIGPNTTMSPRSRYGRQWAAWRFMISRSASVIVGAKFGRGAMRRRTKVGMQRTLQPRIRQKVKQRDRRYRSARLERTGPKGLFQYRTAGQRAAIMRPSRYRQSGRPAVSSTFSRAA